MKAKSTIEPLWEGYARHCYGDLSKVAPTQLGEVKQAFMAGMLTAVYHMNTLAADNEVDAAEKVAGFTTELIKFCENRVIELEAPLN